MQSSGSEQFEHQTLDAQPSTLSSVSSSDSESAATFESESPTVFSRRNSLEQNTETGGDLESVAGAFEVLTPQDNDAHTTVPETQPQGTENYPGYPRRDRPFAHMTPSSEEASSPLLMDHPLAVFGDGQPQPLPQTPGSGSVEHQTQDAQRSTLSSASSSYTESESQSRTVRLFPW
jgi:hypothetical protein